MSAQIAAWGRLGKAPREIETKTGKPMTVADLAVDVGDEQAPEWFGVVAFGRQAEQLAQHKPGESVSVSGRLQRREWTGTDGEQRRQLQIVADGLVSSRSVRPGGGRKRQQQRAGGTTQAEDQAARALYGEPFNDELPDL